MDYSLLLVIEEVQVKKEDLEYVKDNLEIELNLSNNRIVSVMGSINDEKSYVSLDK